jgi:hypothetical protein
MSSVLSAVLGLSFAAGLNTYATILALGVLQRLGVLDLPTGLEVAASAPVMIAAGIMYHVEFEADKVPYVDSIWDAIHTVVRPAAGALLAYAAVGDVRPEWQMIAALAGGSVALTSHTAKASTRAAVNVSPEPFSNWTLSVIEDVVAFALVWLIGTHPYIATGVVIVLGAMAVFIVWKFSKFARRIFRRAA